MIDILVYSTKRAQNVDLCQFVEHFYDVTLPNSMDPLEFVVECKVRDVHAFLSFSDDPEVHAKQKYLHLMTNMLMPSVINISVNSKSYKFGFEVAGKLLTEWGGIIYMGDDPGTEAVELGKEFGAMVFSKPT